MELSEQIFLLSKGVNPLSGEDMPDLSLSHNIEVKRYLDVLANELLELEYEVTLSVDAERTEAPSPAPEQQTKKQTVYRTLTQEQADGLTDKNKRNGKPLRSHFPWTIAEDQQVKSAQASNISIEDIAAQQQRSVASIETKLKNLGLI